MKDGILLRRHDRPLAAWRDGALPCGARHGPGGRGRLRRARVRDSQGRPLSGKPLDWIADELDRFEVKRFDFRSFFIGFTLGRLGEQAFQSEKAVRGAIDSYLRGVGLKRRKDPPNAS